VTEIHDVLESADRALADGRLDEAARLSGELLLEQEIVAERASRAHLCVGRAHGRAGRFFEAAIAGRRMLALERARGSKGEVPTALGLLVVALMNAKATDRVVPLLDELEERLGGVPTADAPHLHRIVQQSRLGLALLARDVAEADRRFARLHAMVAAGLFGPEQAQLLRNSEFHLALSRRDLVRMEEILAEALRNPGPANVHVPEVTFRVGLALAYADAGRLDEARGHALAAAEFLAGAQGGSEVLADDGGELVRLLHDRLNEKDAALRAASAVSTAIVERVARLEASSRTLEAIAGGAGDELIGDLREDFCQTLLRFLDDVRRMLPTPTEDAGESPPGFLPLCAWCSRVRLAPDRWVDLRRFVPSPARHPVTHGICPDCRSRAWLGR
jgi:hypothetical protein